MQYSSLDDLEENFNKVKPMEFDTCSEDNHSLGEQADEESQVMMAKIFMAMIGIGYLFPFSALTQPVDYWTALFPDFNIEFPLTAVFFGVNLFFLFIIVASGGETPNFQLRIVSGFIGQLLILIFVPSLTYMHLPSETVHYNVVIAATAVVAIFTALLDSVVIGFASLYPPKVLEGLQIGIGLSSLIGSVYRIITKLLFPPNDVILSTVIYFVTGAVTIASCIVSYYVLVSMPISKKYLNRALSSEKQASGSGKDGRGGSKNNTSSIIASSEERAPLKVKASMSEVADSPSESATTRLDTFEGRFQVLRKVVFHQALVLVVYMTSLSVFPALITEIPTYSFPWLAASRWWSLLLLLFFCILDTLGRFLTPYRLGMTYENVHWYVFLRILLFPCLYGCLKGQPAFFQSDMLSLMFVGMLGFTNGHMGSICIMIVSERVSDAEKSLVGGFTGIWLNLGLVFGSSLALIVDKWVLHG